mmetsp:Transcript_8207/g.14492  ORF Transcript_8207/g.14492 Transcript_8207/m.14492 type:complete len:234 (-) Transcript_8207:268-969(-)
MASTGRMIGLFCPVFLLSASEAFFFPFLESRRPRLGLCALGVPWFWSVMAPCIPRMRCAAPRMRRPAVASFRRAARRSTFFFARFLRLSSLAAIAGLSRWLTWPAPENRLPMFVRPNPAPASFPMCGAPPTFFWKSPSNTTSAPRWASCGVTALTSSESAPPSRLSTQDSSPLEEPELPAASAPSSSLSSSGSCSRPPRPRRLARSRAAWCAQASLSTSTASSEPPAEAGPSS